MRVVISGIQIAPAIVPVSGGGLRRAGLVVPFTGQPTIPAGSYIRVTANITNVGDEDGEFKLFGFVYHQDGPAAGPDRSYYNTVNAYYLAEVKNAKAAQFNGKDVRINKGMTHTYTVVTEENLMVPGTYRSYMVASVRRVGSMMRLFDREAYGYDDSAFIITGAVPLAGPKASLGPRTYAQA